MESTAIIHARTRRQAMDWSLVLASQGIEPTIQKGEQGFELVVPADHFESAQQAIHKYRAENRAWHWPQQRIGRELLFDWTSAIWILLLAFCYWFSVKNEDFQDAGIFSSSAGQSNGDDPRGAGHAGGDRGCPCASARCRLAGGRGARTAAVARPR